MSVLTTPAEFLRRVTGTPIVRPEPEQISDSIEDVARQIVAGREAEAELRQLAADGQIADAELVAAQEKFNAERRRIAERHTICSTRTEAARIARSRIIQYSRPSAEEQQLTEEGKSLLAKVGPLRQQAGCYDGDMAAPESTPLFAELQSLRARRDELQRVIAKQDGPAGLSAEAFELRRLPHIEPLEEQLDNYRRRFALFQQVQDLKARAADCIRRRDELRQEREDAAIQAALASIAPAADKKSRK